MLKDIIKFRRNEHKSLTASLDINDFVDNCEDFISSGEYDNLSSELMLIKYSLGEITSSDHEVKKFFVIC